MCDANILIHANYTNRVWCD